MNYGAFLEGKRQSGEAHGFAATFLPDALFDFQRALVEWAVRQGRAALFADTGLGKSLMALTWAENVVRHTNKPVLLLTPIAVGPQFVAEGEKFGIACVRSRDGVVPSGARIVVTNYQQLGKFSPADFAGVVCDESSCLKNADAVTRDAVTEFLRTVPYRLLATATAAPNDWTELGTSSEALGYLGHVDMLGRFFVNDQNAVKTNRHWSGSQWRLRGHAPEPFWRWVCSWARAIRKPSDLGFSDARFALPRLTEREHVVKARTVKAGHLFSIPAVGLAEEREERRRTIAERCEAAAALVTDTGNPAIVWCHLNPEGDLLERLIPGAIQVAGADTDDAKEEKMAAFISGEARVLIIKPVIGCWGLNLQHCAHVVTFASHSYEQHYQAVRRCWRFGQTKPVTVDLVATEAERGIRENLRRKQTQADEMFDALVRYMREAQGVARTPYGTVNAKVPTWL